ncbi:hypothetical protein ACFL6S_03465 [Candidatus Poribacteria bacterium]
MKEQHAAYVVIVVVLLAVAGLYVTGELGTVGVADWYDYYYDEATDSYIFEAEMQVAKNPTDDTIVTVRFLDKGSLPEIWQMDTIEKRAYIDGKYIFPGVGIVYGRDVYAKMNVRLPKGDETVTVQFRLVKKEGEATTTTTVYTTTTVQPGDTTTIPTTTTSSTTTVAPTTSTSTTSSSSSTSSVATTIPDTTTTIESGPEPDTGFDVAEFFNGVWDALFDWWWPF